ncbi:O-antigen translocase [Yeosuana marina]|uniref:O-antigen translocase n=1 Tax=Yeosuana marina TaxID=1565536 RepID=UPI0030ED6D70
MKLFKEHKDLFLIKLFSVNSLGVVLRSVLGLISQKLIAVYLGPTGVALVGNLRNAFSLFGLGATTGIDQGVLKYQSEFDGKPIELKKLYETSIAFSFLGSIIIFIILFFGASFWSSYLFKTPDYAYLFVILSFSMPFTAIYNLCFAIINGQSNYKKATLLSFTTYATVTFLVIGLVVFYKLSGALLAVVLTPIAQLVSLFVFAKKELRLFSGLRVKFNKLFKNKLFVFIIMAIAAVVLNNLVELQLRNHLIKKLSIKEAGYWTSILSLSNYYMSFMTGVYSLYILPKYSKMDSFKVFKLELINIYKIIIPIFTVMFIGIYFFREFIIKLLYTSEFVPMESLFKWQLIGDLVKIVAVIMAYQFIAQKLWKIFIITEAISYILLYFFGMYFVDKIGVEGIVFAHFLRYVVYLMMIIFLIQNIFKKQKAINENKYS